MRRFLLILIIVAAGCNQYSRDKSSLRDSAAKTPPTSGIVYRNPRVYNVDYSFEMVPDPNNIDRAKDIKLWIPIPREWDSQKAVKIISVQPPPHAEYEEPEHGNRMLFWDFGEEPEKPSYKVDIKYRLSSYEAHAHVDPNRIGPYDKMSKEYALYTRSTCTIPITPKIRELAQQAVGDEKNPYIQAKRIFQFFRNRMRYKMTFERGIQFLLDNSVKDEQTGEEYYLGACGQHSSLFVALCRAVGIPARAVAGFVGHCPWITADDLTEPFSELDTKLSPGGLAGGQHYIAGGPHVWAEFYLPNYGWIHAETNGFSLRPRDNRRLILHKGRDIKIGPNAPQNDSGGYGFQWVAINNGRADLMQSGIWNIAKIRTAKVTLLHHPDPFPADAFAGYLAEMYPPAEAEDNLTNYRKRTLISIDNAVRDYSEMNSDLARVYRENPRLRYQQEPFVCHMLRKLLGDKNFSDVFDAYANVRANLDKPVSRKRFEEIAHEIYGKSLDWFFEQWLERHELPQLKLHQVTVSKRGKNWRVQGSLQQLSESLFRLPVELEIETEKKTERITIWLETRDSVFEFSAHNVPKRILVDPDYDILKVQKMPVLLSKFWRAYPNMIIIYGTAEESEANKTAAEHFVDEDLGLGRDKIKADTDVNEVDLK
ncbi:MAG: hypothetical protein KAV87_60965, partial [Desulfobacteraceae bacterium]|nr:hypothetical protein [Desulfobacteraceae bacterium]